MNIITCRGSIHNNGSQIDLSTETFHSSQEHLCDGASSEVEADESLHSISTNINESTSTVENSYSQQSTSRQSIRNRNKHKVVRTKSPTRLQSDLNDPLNGNAHSDGEVSTCKSGYRSYLIIICIFFCVCVIILQWNQPVKKTTVINTVNMCSYSDLKAKYPNESDYLWKNMKHGVENILNELSDKPSVFLFLHSGEEVSNNLVKDIANTASSCLDSSKKPVEIKSIDYISGDGEGSSRFIRIYKNNIKERNVVLIPNLNEIPVEEVMGLHAICDTYSPIVRKVIILLSLVTEHKKERDIDTAREALQQLWRGKIADYEFDPLIARVTDQVISLQSK